jgi:RNA polymerase sigma-70 factor (ECF subfamily)
MNAVNFVDYYDQYKNKIFSYLYYRSGRNRELAEDLTSEVFMKALEKFHTYQEEKNFQSWIYAIAHNHLIDHFRKDKPTVDIEPLENLLETDTDPKSSLLKRVAAEQVEELLSSLDDEEREILLLRYQQDLPMLDIADIVGKPDSTVRVIIHRALAKLRKRYASVYACFAFIISSFLSFVSL